jgi:UPF0755 protein
MKYRRNLIQKRWLGIPRRVWYLLLALIILGLVGVLVVRQLYNADLKPVSRDTQSQVFTVNDGDSVKEIADNLKHSNLIRSPWALELYVHSEELGSELQAGTYALSPSETTQAIITTLTKGKVTSRLVTILPGRRIDQVRADLINDGFSPSDVASALQPNQYDDLPALAYKPTMVTTLEGLLWPDSFQKDASTDASQIIRESLVEMGQHITPDVQAEFAAEGLTVYQGITLTSIVDQEVNKPTDQAQAAEVFLSRIKLNMPLGSDVTAFYGAIAAGKPASLTYDSPYNTLLHVGLPPTPISSISSSALQAVTHPASTNWLYFVTGDNGTTYFSTTEQDHEAQTAKYCHKLCASE